MVINRRGVVAGLAAATALASAGLMPFSKKAFSAEECRRSPLGNLCSSFLPIEQLTKVYASQALSEWCWAASISMIFALNGHPVSQQRVVHDAYGAIVNMPGNYNALVGSLDRNWIDDDGDEFTTTIDKLFSMDSRTARLSNEDILEALGAGNGLLYCTTTHAMVLTAMKYLPGANGPRVVEAWVMDPWPGAGLRRLSARELTPGILGGDMRMVASVGVS